MYRFTDTGIFQIPAGAKIVCPFKRPQTKCGAHIASYSVGTGIKTVTA